MEQNDIKKILKDDTNFYEESREDTLSSIIREFYSKRMRWIAINVYAWFLVFLVPLIYSGIKFFKTDSTKFQIMYAAIFVCCITSIGFIKVFAWQMLHRNNINRELKRLELRVAELSQAVKNRQT